MLSPYMSNVLFLSYKFVAIQKLTKSLVKIGSAEILSYLFVFDFFSFVILLLFVVVGVVVHFVVVVNSRKPTLKKLDQ